MRGKRRILVEVGGDQIEFVEHECDVFVELDQHGEPSVCVVVVLQKRKNKAYAGNE